MKKLFFALLVLVATGASAQNGVTNAFRFGPPPHGGMAYGLDRLAMLICGSESIRDVIAFPKVQNASCPLTGAPDAVDEKQLRELRIACIPEEE